MWLAAQNPLMNKVKIIRFSEFWQRVSDFLIMAISSGDRLTDILTYSMMVYIIPLVQSIYVRKSFLLR
jgi:hypothetical protein